LIQLIAESYDLMKRGLRPSDEKLSVVHRHVKEAGLNAYLMETTSHIFCKVDERNGKRLLDVILDEAE